MTPACTRNRIIGLLGGSFNPAHSAHLYLSLYALKTLGLDEVWWLVSPQNPLKKASDLAQYETRLALARRMAAGHKKLRVMDVERQWRSYYTCDTLAHLKRRCKGAHFIWLMGADNLAQFHRWRRWQGICAQVPIAVFDRAPHSHSALRSKAYLRNKKYLIKNNSIAAAAKAPALAFLPMPRQWLSSSHLRKTLGADAFLGHNEVIAGG